MRVWNVMEIGPLNVVKNVYVMIVAFAETEQKISMAFCAICLSSSKLKDLTALSRFAQIDSKSSPSYCVPIRGFAVESPLAMNKTIILTLLSLWRWLIATGSATALNWRSGTSAAEVASVVKCSGKRIA